MMSCSVAPDSIFIKGGIAREDFEDLKYSSNILVCGLLFRMDIKVRKVFAWKVLESMNPLYPINEDQDPYSNCGIGSSLWV